MMKRVYAITDHRGYFESKYNAIPYRSGMDKDLLEKHFSEFDFQIIFIKYSEVITYPKDFWTNTVIIYASSEDTGLHYKSFIEDIIYYLELCNARVIPSFKYLKSNNNKVFMELLRHQMVDVSMNNLKTSVFGCLEEVKGSIDSFNFPLVYKKSAGAMSKGVGIANNKLSLIRKLKRISRTPNCFQEIWELGRKVKYKNYKKESKFREKFIVQDFIPFLKGDFKILIFSDKYFVLERGIKNGDFRASGSGIRNFVKDIPSGLLDFASLVFKALNVPNASLDIAFNGKSFFLLEFQCLYFGSFTLTYSEFYWLKDNNRFDIIESKSELEHEYVRSIVNYLDD